MRILSTQELPCVSAGVLTCTTGDPPEPCSGLGNYSTIDWLSDAYKRAVDWLSNWLSS